MKMNAALLTDFYKVGHPFQYPDNTTLVYSNMTPRKSRVEGFDKVVFFGLQYFIKEYLISYFNENFFYREHQEIMDNYKRRIKTSLGSHLKSYAHIEALHKLGFLPIEIKALPEGSLVDTKVPIVTIRNTIKEFYWVTNFVETLISASLWQACTSATIAHLYRKILDSYAKRTGIPKEFVPWQAHDFSFRGMSSLESAIISGMAHLLSFTGTDTIPAIDAHEKYYNANADKEMIGGSVNATEHSVMCAGGQDGELETIERLITEVYPEGIISIVMDTWDLWKVCTEHLVNLKTAIMSRNGKVVIRPDSGNPELILCGNPLGKSEEERKGVVRLLWERFPGPETSTGYRMIDPHVGVIYGDSITLQRAESICANLASQNFASQVVFGVGSYTYQYNTRDTFGFAMKATYVEVGDDKREIFKCPVTDDGTKKSATGLLCVENGKLLEKVTWEKERTGELKPVFRDGIILKNWSLADIRRNLNG